MEVDFMRFYIQTGKNLDKLLSWCSKGRISKITVDMTKYKYPLTKKQIVALKQVEKMGVVVEWK